MCRMYKNIYMNIQENVLDLLPIDQLFFCNQSQIFGGPAQCHSIMPK